MRRRNLLATLFLTGWVTSCGGGGGGGGGGGDSVAGGPGGGTGGGGGGGSGGSGGGTIGFDTGTSGTSGVTGTIQGFGSVIVNDREMTTEDAMILIEGAQGGETSLSQGQQVVIVGDFETDEAFEVRYRSNVKGPVTAITLIDEALGTATLTVLGQGVATNAATAYRDTSLGLIAVGQLLEISGQRDANGVLVATYIQQKPVLSEFKAIGIVQALNGTVFELDGLTVESANAMLQNFDGQPIEIGAVVEVKIESGDFVSPDRAEARVVERLPILGAETGVELEIEGFIDRFVSLQDFDVSGFGAAADASTIFVNGTAQSVALNVKVEVEGTVGEAGELLVSRLIIKTTEAIRAEGHVDDVDVLAGSVTVLGVTFFVRDLTELEDDSDLRVEPFTLDDLMIGDEVEVRGYLDGTTVIAARLDRDDGRDRARLRGPVDGEDPAAGTVDVLGVAIQSVAGVTEFEDGGSISQAEFFDRVEAGAFIQVRWEEFSSTDLVADRIEIERSN